MQEHNWHQLTGKWVGRKKIYLKPDELHSDNIWEMSINTRLQDSFLLMEYTHKYENKNHEGILLLGYVQKDKRYQASWIDQWHMQDEIMHLEGKQTDDGIVLHGEYGDEGNKWGWDIKIVHKDNELHITHYNITPDKLRAVAVEMACRPVGNF